ncbi:MAG: trans-aconitate 2-methyltransferase [Acidimicrobiales bacterium]
MSAWEPDQYHRFQAERSRPFRDLLALIAPSPGGKVIDLGCGTGELTVELHGHTGAACTLGIDSSPEMLERATPLAGDGVTFSLSDIGQFEEAGAFDVVAANASLQWLPDHADLLARLVRSLRPGGQIAIQVPANVDHPSHMVSATLAAGEMSHLFPDGPPPDPVLGVLRPEAYAELLDDLGAVDQHVRLQVYGHHLAAIADVVEWVRGTSLTRFARALSASDYERFVARYQEELLRVLGDRRPYFYAFKRILLWARF